MTISRVAPSGASIHLVMPAELGDHHWFASTKLAGHRSVRQFTIAPAGRHRVIPVKIIPGATRTDWQLPGHDLVLFEAADRSNACLLWIGPYHEATTWFGGPAPGRRGLNRLIGAVEFTDSPQGAILRPRLPQYVRPFGTTVIASGAESLLMIRSAADGLSALPDWSGRRLAGGELWRTGRTLDETAAARIAGSVHEWRYLWAGRSCVVDVVLHGPESGVPASRLDASGLLSALDRLHVTWT
jgi:hypothetical protein